MVNKDYDAEDLMGRDVLEFWSKMAECASFRQRILAIEKYLLPFAARARVRTLIMRTAKHILVCRGAVRIDEIAFHAALSVRQFERRFSCPTAAFKMRSMRSDRLRAVHGSS
jgi:hypothetical protein